MTPRVREHVAFTARHLDWATDALATALGISWRTAHRHRLRALGLACRCGEAHLRTGCTRRSPVRLRVASERPDYVLGPVPCQGCRRPVRWDAFLRRWCDGDRYGHYCKRRTGTLG